MKIFLYKFYLVIFNQKCKHPKWAEIIRADNEVRVFKYCEICEQGWHEKDGEKIIYE